MIYIYTIHSFFSTFISPCRCIWMVCKNHNMTHVWLTCVSTMFTKEWKKFNGKSVGGIIQHFSTDFNFVFDNGKGWCELRNTHEPCRCWKSNRCFKIIKLKYLRWVWKVGIDSVKTTRCPFLSEWFWVCQFAFLHHFRFRLSKFTHF